MSSDQEFVDFIIDQGSRFGRLTYRKMFGEYAVYKGNKVVALICDNKVFIKPTLAGRGFIGDVVEASAYPGAKLSFLIEDNFEDRDWFSELIKITSEALPEPKPKNKRPK
jgi:TfoX/Sxy family transcriptional regulator of competence genes